MDPRQAAALHNVTQYRQQAVRLQQITSVPGDAPQQREQMFGLLLDQMDTLDATLNAVRTQYRNDMPDIESFTSEFSRQQRILEQNQDVFKELQEAYNNYEQMALVIAARGLRNDLADMGYIGQHIDLRAQLQRAARCFERRIQQAGGREWFRGIVSKFSRAQMVRYNDFLLDPAVQQEILQEFGVEGRAPPPPLPPAPPLTAPLNTTAVGEVNELESPHWSIRAFAMARRALRSYGYAFAAFAATFDDVQAAFRLFEDTERQFREFIRLSDVTRPDEESAQSGSVVQYLRRKGALPRRLERELYGDVLGRLRRDAKGLPAHRRDAFGTPLRYTPTHEAPYANCGAFHGRLPRIMRVLAMHIAVRLFARAGERVALSLDMLSMRRVFLRHDIGVRSEDSAHPTNRAHEASVTGAGEHEDQYVMIFNCSDRDTAPVIYSIELPANVSGALAPTRPMTAAEIEAARLPKSERARRRAGGEEAQATGPKQPRQETEEQLFVFCSDAPLGTPYFAQDAPRSGAVKRVTLPAGHVLVLNATYRRARLRTPQPRRKDAYPNDSIALYEVLLSVRPAASADPLAEEEDEQRAQALKQSCKDFAVPTDRNGNAFRLITRYSTLNARDASLWCESALRQQFWRGFAFKDQAQFKRYELLKDAYQQFVQGIDAQDPEKKERMEQLYRSYREAVEELFKVNNTLELYKQPDPTQAVRDVVLLERPQLILKDWAEEEEEEEDPMQVDPQESETAQDLLQKYMDRAYVNPQKETLPACPSQLHAPYEQYELQLFDSRQRSDIVLPDVRALSKLVGAPANAPPHVTSNLQSVPFVRLRFS